MILPRKRSQEPERPSQPVRHENCWAKTTANDLPGINVHDHCLNVGCVAEALIKLLPIHLRNLLPSPNSAATLASLHDLGKISPGFQAKSTSWRDQHGLRNQALSEGWGSGESNHAKISESTIRRLLANPSLEKWAAIVGAHHGLLSGSLLPNPSNPYPWEEERNRLAETLILEFGALPNQPAEEAILWFTAGLITVADWIGSENNYFPQDAQWDIKQRRSRASDALRDSGWTRITVKPSLSFTVMFSPRVWGWSSNPGVVNASDHGFPHACGDGPFIGNHARRSFLKRISKTH
jgi:CRISPR-associated endonuclease/helicase Cas3